MSVKFTDNSMKIMENLKSGISSFLYEAGGELEARTMRNSRVDSEDTKGSYQYKVEEGETESAVYVGSNLENAIWEEFGTGEYALKGNGRKGGWVYKSQKDGKFYRTKGKTPNRPMQTAFDSSKGKIKNRLQDVLKSI